ncbi:MAG: hypothetical protein EP330_29165 [Deltaproteobacteria bacterium]|nr:MAG: hypothetical protein EP330_29165 [Deltaproteobacteria bacterium]
MTYRILIAAFLLAGCGDPGPTPEEVAAKELDRECGKLYSSLTKVYQDELYKGGVADVRFAEKADFVKECAASGLTEEQRKCMDPNLGGGEECAKALEPAKEKAKKLQDLLLAPMKEKPEAEAPAEGEAKSEEG